MKKPRRNANDAWEDTQRRFWERVEITPEGCWQWQGYLTPKGYGSIKESNSRRSVLAHRLAWRIAFGNLPDELQVCHKCDNRRCVRPSHLFLGTNQDNVSDMVEKGRVQNGATHYRARLSEDKTDAIKHLLDSKKYTQKQIAAIFGVSQNTISAINRGNHWTQKK